ncbi:acyl-CoA dehydrogenase family protein [Jannaschia sp. KMU-145]|uniref:acyl-CoA dehydrogenase family protein n=1 Tax=Jannaschia halovivens TaxID=3388667 RepID=UPI00396B2CC8
MNFELSDEGRMLQDGLRRFLANAYDATGRTEAADAPGGFAPRIWSGLAEMGVIGALFREEVGGFGGTGFDIALVFEEMGRAGAVDPLLDTGILGGGLLAACGAEIDGVIDGTVQIAVAMGEPGGRYDPMRVATKATPDGDGWRLDGRKAVVVNAPAADRVLVTARDGDRIGLYEVAPSTLDLRAYPLVGGGMAAEVTLDGAPATRLSDDASDLLRAAIARATLAQCAEALGLMEAIRALTTDYLRTRKQFGRPIGTFQVLQHRMADLLIEIEQARSAVINLAGHVDGPDRDRHVAATKNLVSEVARLVVEEAIQMHGGIGMTQEYDLGQLAKRLSMVEHRFGDAMHHMQRFIALTAA